MRVISPGINSAYAGPAYRLAPATNQMTGSHVPLAAQYPRRGAGASAPNRRREAMAPAPPLPPTPRRAQWPGQGKPGQEQGRAGEAVRALCVPYVKDTHGISRLITVSRNCCSTAVSCTCHVVPKLSAKNGCCGQASASDSPGQGMKMVGHQLSGCPVIDTADRR